MITLSPLEEIPLGIGREEIDRLFMPFTRVDEEMWQHRAAKHRRRLWRRYLRRRLMGWRDRRVNAAITKEYGAEWRQIDYRTYALDGIPDPRSLYQWEGKRYLASNRGSARVRQLFLVRAIELLKPRRVIEVGCGNGINLILLASRFPEISFTGVDLTPEGIEAAKMLQRQSLLPDYLQAFAPLSVSDPCAFKRIDFQTGDASSLRFPAKSFDLVITVLSLEQMERVRSRALNEIARVSSGHAFMIEPFRDANRNGASRRYIITRDYLRARLADLKPHGLHPLWATADMPQEIFLQACAVLAKVA